MEGVENLGDTNHAWAYRVTELLRSQGPDQEPQLVPSLSSDFKDCGPSQRGVCQDKICVSILAKTDTDLPFLKLLMTVIRASIIVTPPQSVTSGWFSEGNMPYTCLRSIPEETDLHEERSPTLCCPSYGYLC